MALSKGISLKSGTGLSKGVPFSRAKPASKPSTAPPVPVGGYNPAQLAKVMNKRWTTNT